jgi:hypothetical protein
MVNDMNDEQIEAAANRLESNGDTWGDSADYLESAQRDSDIDECANWILNRFAADRAEREERDRDIGVKFIESLLPWDDELDVWWTYVRCGKEHLPLQVRYSKCDDAEFEWILGDGDIASPLNRRGQLLDLLAALGVNPKGEQP